MLPLLAFSGGLVETILKYSGIAGVILLFLYWVFQETIKRKLFATLTQKRRVFILVLTPLLIWSIGVLIIIFDYLRHIPPATSAVKNFLYQGQIIDSNGAPVTGAFAYVIFGNDTIHAEANTGRDGEFTIRLDTAEGIKTTVYYGHAKYGTNTVFRALNSSTNERLILPCKEKPESFIIIPAYDGVPQAIEKESALKYTIQNPTHRIELRFDKVGLDSFDGRWRYLGGKVQVYVDGAFCCSSAEKMHGTHTAGSTYENVQSQVFEMMRQTFLKEKSQLIPAIVGCLGSRS